MIAFIGVRISWLIAARNADFAWLAASAASRRLAQVAEQPRVVDRDRGVLGEPDQEVELGVGEGLGAGTGRQTAIMPLTPARPSSGATIRRSLSSTSRVPGMSTARWSARRR